MESRWEVRRLAPSTKLALANALKKLLQKKFLDDITVKELVEECEVNRQTFYYHFRTSTTCCAGFWSMRLQRRCGGGLLAGRLRAAFRYVQDNHLAIYHVYRSSDGTTWTATFQPGPCHHRLHFGGECTGPAPAGAGAGFPR